MRACRGGPAASLSIADRKRFNCSHRSVELRREGRPKPEEETSPGPRRQTSSLLRKPPEDLNVFVPKATGRHADCDTHAGSHANPDETNSSIRLFLSVSDEDR